MTGVMIADEMGLGKTVQALAVLAAADAFPAVVVCPASLKLNWHREANRWLPERTVQVVSGTRPKGWGDADITVINYDVLGSWVDAMTTGGVLPAGLVFDESHYLKNGSTQRTRAAITLSDRMAPDAVRLCLSGTPFLNRPSEIVTQLRVLQRLGEFGGLTAFKERYNSGANLPELNRRLRASCYVRRRKADVLTDLPPKRWSTVVVEGDPTVMRTYREAEANIVRYLGEQARLMALEAGADDAEARRAAIAKQMRARAAEHLVAITHLKRLAAQAKLAAVNEWVAGFIGGGNKLVVFGYHEEIVGELANRYACGRRITGTTPMAERQEIVDGFQTIDSQQVIACSIRAAGVGLTLTAASDVLFVEQGWTPADMDQAADRCHRIGQQDSVTAWTMLTAGTIDEDIADLIARKRTVVGAATDGHDIAADQSILGDLVMRLAGKADPTP